MDVNNSIGLEKCQSPPTKPGFTLSGLFTFISFELAVSVPLKFEASFPSKNMHRKKLNMQNPT